MITLEVRNGNKVEAHCSDYLKIDENKREFKLYSHQDKNFIKTFILNDDPWSEAKVYIHGVEYNLYESEKLTEERTPTTWEDFIAMRINWGINSHESKPGWFQKFWDKMIKSFST